MKKRLTVFLTVCILLAAASPLSLAVTLCPTAQTVVMNGQTVELEVYNIAQHNYFKLRDVAMLYNGTASSFSVEYRRADNSIHLTTGAEYRPVGGECTVRTGVERKASPTRQKLYIDGTAVQLTAYSIGGNNFFKLRDLGDALNFFVGYDALVNTVIMHSADFAVGNTAGNTANGGWLCANGTGSSGQFYLADPDGAFCCLTPGEGGQFTSRRVTEPGCSFLNVDDDAIYFVKGRQIYRMELDGSGTRLFFTASDVIQYLTYLDGQLYFCVGAGSIYRMDVDLTRYTLLGVEDTVYAMSVCEDSIWFIDGSCRICRLSTKGGASQVIYDKAPCYGLCVDGDRLYASRDTDLAVFSLSGSLLRTLPIDTVSINLCGGWLYYGDRATCDLWRMTTDGQTSERLVTGLPSLPTLIQAADTEEGTLVGFAVGQTLTRYLLHCDREPEAIYGITELFS